MSQNLAESQLLNTEVIQKQQEKLIEERKYEGYQNDSDEGGNEEEV